MRKRKLPLILILIIFIFSSCMPVAKVPALTDTEIEESENTALFHFIDVGQGDCILIKDSSACIMIDAGTTQSGSIICEYLENMGIDYLDCFIGTHPHEDHLGGASAVLSGVDVGKVYLNGETSTSYFFERLVDTLLDENITPYKPDIGKIYNVGNFEVEFLSPSEDFGNANDNSLVTRVTYKDVSALFMGDAERAVEASLIDRGINLRADILKVGHHGSRYASSAEFLNAVYPDVAIIQCGEGNSYGHPHKEAISRLDNIQAKTLRNDKSGNILLRTDGKSIYDASGEAVKKAENAQPVSLTFLGNKKSKTFHSESCANLPAEKNTVIFTTRQEAVNSGYSPCGNCKP